MITMLTRGREFWSLRNHGIDTSKTLPASQCTVRAFHQPIEYEKPDGVLTFDLLDSLSRSGTHHDHDQPSHLRIK